MPSNAPLAWDEVDDGPLPWDEVTDAPHQASRTSQSGSFLPGSEIRTSEEAPTNFTTMVQAENESNRPATLPSILTGGFMPLQGEGVNIGGAGSLSPFRYKKSTKADLAEEQAAIAKENEDVTPLSVTRAGNAYSSLLQIGQEQLGGALKSISKAASNNPGLFRRDDMAPFEEAEIARRQKMSGSQKWKEDVNQPLYTAGQALEQSAPESHPVIEPDSTAAGIGRAVGGFIPAIFAGEFAPVMFGLQAAGGVLDRAYQRNIDAGMDPDKAADEATKVALAEGTFQTLLMKFFPGQARKLGDAGIEKMLGTAMRQELKSKATRFAAGRAAQAVEGAGFGAASAAGSNLIQGNPIGEGMGESAKGMSIIQALTPRGGTPGEINAHNERVKNYISEVGRYEKENQRHQQREKLIAEEGEPTAQDRADLKQVKSEVEQGKRILTPETRAYIANLELKTSEPQIMQAEHEYQLHDEAAAENRPVSFGKLGSGEIAMRNRDGSIVVDDYELAKALAHLPTEKEKSDLIHRVVNEESVHGVTNDSEALSFFLNGSTAERKLAAHRYYGDDFDPKKHNLNDPMQQTLIGHEMIRARIQEMQGLSPTEVAYMTGWGRDRSQGLLAMERAVFALRKFSNREGAKAQQGILDSVYSKLQKAREIVGKQAPQEADPFSVRPKSRSPEDAENRRKEQEARMASSREMMGMTTDQLRQFGVGGFNKQNVELGLHATPEHLAELKNLKDSVDPQYEKLLAKVDKTPEDLQKFADLASKRQYFNEAIKMAELKERENLTYDGKVGNRMQFTIRGGLAHDVQFTTADYASPDDIAAAKHRIVKQWEAEENYSIGQNKKIDDQWTERESKALGIRVLPDPLSRRPGESKQDELRRMAEEIRLRKLQAQGVELPPEHAAKLGLKAKDVTDLAPVASEDRVTAEQSGALPRLTGRNLEEHAAEVLRGEVNVRKIRESKALKKKNENRKKVGLPPIMPKVRYKVPHFQDFSEWASNNLEGVKPHQVRQIWEDEVWKMLLNDEGPGIEKLRKGLGLEANYGTSKVAPPEKPVPEFQLEQGETRSEKKASKATREARQRYRNKLQAAIGLKLIGQSLEGRPSLERSSITVDDIDFSGGEGTNKENKYGPYTEINRHDLADPRRLLDILNDEARASSADSKSATRRLMAVVDHTNGKVYLVSTFNDAGVQRVTDPTGPSVKNKPNRELNKTFLNQYRPFASILIADPVKGFRQSFDSVSDFNERIGSEAAERSRIGEFPYPPEAKPDEDFAAEGTPGLEGEGGSFMGPSKQTLGVTTISGARDSRAKLTKAEAAGIYNHVRSEAGEMSTAEDVQVSFEGLADKSQRGKLSAADHLALIAYRKIFAKLEALHPNDSTDTLMRDMTQILLQSRDASMSREGFANLLQSDFGESQAEPVSQPSKTARDLILPGGYRPEMHKAWRAASSNPMMPRTDIRPPTSQEQFSGPFQREAAPSPELGRTEGKPFIPSSIEEKYVPQRVRKFLESRKGPDYEADIDRAAHNRLVQAKLDKQIQEAKEMRARILRKQGKLMSYADAAKLVGYKGPMSRRPGQRNFILTSERVLDEMPKGAILSRHLFATLSNKIPPDEMYLLRSMGLEKEIDRLSEDNHGKVKASEVKQWIKYNGPKVHVITYSGSDNPALLEGHPDQQQLNQINSLINHTTHSWVDGLSAEKKNDLNMAMEPLFRDQDNQHQPLQVYLRSRNWDESDINMADMYERMLYRRDMIRDVISQDEGWTEFQQASEGYRGIQVYHDNMIHPTDPSKSPIHRVDVVVGNMRSMASKALVTHSPDYTHEQVANTIAWAAVQFEQVKGEKVAHIFEVQSRLARQVEEREKAIRNQRVRAIPEINLNAHRKFIEQFKHPILRHTNRLAIKAAIDYAREKGATKFAISDYPTASMSEGHDQDIRLPDGGYNADSIAGHVVWQIGNNENGWSYLKSDPKDNASAVPVHLTGRVRVEDGRILAEGVYPSGELEEIYSPKLPGNLFEDAYHELLSAHGAPSHEAGMNFNYGSSYSLVDRKTGATIKSFESREEAVRYVNHMADKGLLARDALDPESGTLNIIHGDLHKIAEDLSGSKGEKVSFGEHWRARKRYPAWDDEGMSDIQQSQEFETRREADDFAGPEGRVYQNADGTWVGATKANLSYKPTPEIREDLIHLNEKGSLKTDASGKAYPIPEEGEYPYTVFGPKSRRPGAAREALEKFKEFARSPSIPAPERVILDTSSPLPRFALNVDETMTKAMGIERIPLIGRLWGPRGRMRDAVDRALVGYSVKRNIGNSQAALIGSRMNALVEHLGHPFKQDENGRITNVKGDPKQSRFISDLFEDWQKQFVVPDRMKQLTTINHVGREVNVYKPSDVAEYESKHPKTIELSKNQEAIFQEMYRFIKDGYEYLEEKNASLEKYRGESRESRQAQHVMEGLPRGVEWYPFPRVALYKRSEGPVKSEIYRRIGGQYNIENERQYKTEQQGQPTTAYEPDMVKRLVVFAQRIYKAVADTDLVHNKALEGKTAEERVPILAKLHERELRSGEMNQERIHEMAQRPMLSTEGEVLGHPGFQGRIYPKKIADKINRALGSQQNHVVHAASEVSTMFKAFMLTGDLAQYLQQGAPMMFRRPKIWANATTKSIKSILDPNVTGRYLSNPENYKAATEFAQSGGSLGHLHDFMSGANPGEIATKIPGVRQMVERSGRAFGTFFDIAKVEMWKSLREGTPKDQWPQMVETIDNIVLSGKMEAAGVTPGRAAAERIVFMASAYYRGALQLVAGLAERGASGSEVRKVLGTYATGLTSLMVGSYLASGMSWQEIRRRLTPGRDNPKFLSYPVKIGNTTHEIGPGGIVLQLVGLGFDMASEAIQHPKKSWLGAKPLLNYLRTKLGPIPSMVMDAVTQKDAFGRPVHPGEAAVRMVTPVSAQQPINRLIGLANGSKSDIAGDVLDSTAGFVGVKSRLSSKMSEMSKLAAKFMEKNNLKKETGWDLVQNDEASYGQLRSAAIAGNQREFNRAYDALRETHKPQEIRQAMIDWLNRGFTGGKKYEDKFRHSLSPEDLKSYIEAKQEKKRIWAAFLTMKMKKK